MTATVILCYLCRSNPAGNHLAGANSAYCTSCQPVRSGPKLKGIQCRCSGCGQVFATLSDFDSHRTGDWQCASPASAGLELADGAWGTPAGNTRRAEKAAQMAEFNAARSRG